MKRIRSGDTVIVTTGKSKGLVGKVMSVLEQGTKVIVEGANLIKKHVRPNPQANQKGGILSFESPINVSNVALYDFDSKKAGKVGFKYLDDEKKTKVRYFKATGNVIDAV